MEQVVPRKKRVRRLNYDKVDCSKLTSLLAKKAAAPRLTARQRFVRDWGPAVRAARQQGHSWQEIAADFAAAGLRIKWQELRTLFKDEE